MQAGVYVILYTLYASLPLLVGLIILGDSGNSFSVFFSLFTRKIWILKAWNAYQNPNNQTGKNNSFSTYQIAWISKKKKKRKKFFYYHFSSLLNYLIIKFYFRVILYKKLKNGLYLMEVRKNFIQIKNFIHLNIFNMRNYQ